ncbi:alpha/beta fold hydrolase [Anthocerotibacter panamensis]|uniref:alpha/beta fold hydrolase n=1 Tax=Anthocerotibacter panamensis TaxID=2857077 RepID=UPI001C408BAA|nr:alpha/beta fold hydrolase [Anthocerotibacter panamensis]
MVTTLRLEPRTWTWRGYQLNYVVQGQGQPLVLLHGFGASVGHWRKNIPVLAAHYRVYALDWLGFGASAKPPLDYSLDLWEAQLLDFIAEFVPEPVVLMGNSIGALIALMASAHAPAGRIRGTALLNCAGGLTHRPEELPLLARPVMAAFQFGLRLPGVGAFLFNRVRSPRNIRNTLRQVYGNREAVTDELVDLLYQPSSDSGAARVFINVITAPAGIPPETLLPQVNHPVLVLWGETDPWTPIQRGATFSQYHPNLTFIPLPQTGHCPHDERPEVVHSHLLPWLRDL